MDEGHRRFPGDNVERYHPRAGLWCMIVAFPTWIIFLVNGMLGFFPAVIFADGGVGQKFHFWLFLKDRLFGGSPDPVWSEAGAMTSQEWLLLVLALPATIGAIYSLRRRPEFGAIQRGDQTSERESLEVGAVGIGFSGGGDAHTQSIVESVIAQEQVLDQGVVSAALGEMGVIAAANAAESAEQEEIAAVVEPIHDSRFTTTIPDDETLDMVSSLAEEEDEIGWGVWEPDTELDTASETEPESESEPEPEPETELELEEERELPEIPEIFREPVVASPDPLEIPSIPEIPTIEAPKSNITERISTMMTQAADATVDATKEVVSATMSGAKEVASMAAGLTEKVVEKVRQKSTKGVMPVRPTGLPPMAEWDAYQGAWTIMGRPVQVASKPEPEVATPSWSHEEVVLTATAIDPPAQHGDESKPRRNTPFIPELP